MTTTLSRPPKIRHNFKRAAILFAGGPAPAANAVISTAGVSFLRNDIEVLGIQYGYSRTRVTDSGLRHPLAVLATRLPWAVIEASLAPRFERKDRPGQLIAGQDMLGPTTALVGAGRSNAGRPRMPIRLMASRLKLMARSSRPGAPAPAGRGGGRAGH